MSYHRAILLAYTLAAILAGVLAYDLAHAGVFIEAQAGASYMPFTAQDGLWRQDAFGTSYQGVKLVYGGRIGWRFKAPYSIQAGLIRFGTSRVETNAVADHCYDDKSHTVKCGEQPMSLKVANSMTGYTLSGTRYFALTDTWSVPVSVGMAIVTARLRADDAFHPQFKQERYDRLPMWSVGAGLCWLETLCWETTVYTAIPGPVYHDPVSTQVISSTFGWRYHF